MEYRDNIFSSHLGRAQPGPSGPAQSQDVAGELAVRAMLANGEFKSMAAPTAAIIPPQHGGGIMSKLVAALAQPEAEASLSNTNRGSGIVQSVTLPTVLHSLLSEPSLSSVMSWLPQGRIWRINDVSVFEKLILPVFFQNLITPNTLSMFFDALKEWGFEHLAVENNAVAFHSRFFVQEAPLLSLMMRRTPPYQAPAPQAQITAGLLQLLQNPSAPGALSIAPSILAQHNPEDAHLPNTNERAFNKLLCTLNQQQTLAANTPEKVAARPMAAHAPALVTRVPFPETPAPAPVTRVPSPEMSAMQEPEAPSAPLSSHVNNNNMEDATALPEAAAQVKDDQTNMDRLSIAKFLISQAASSRPQHTEGKTFNPAPPSDSMSSVSTVSALKHISVGPSKKSVPKKRAGKKKFLPPKTC